MSQVRSSVRPIPLRSRIDPAGSCQIGARSLSDFSPGPALRRHDHADGPGRAQPAVVEDDVEKARRLVGPVLGREELRRVAKRLEEDGPLDAPAELGRRVVGQEDVGAERLPRPLADDRPGEVLEVGPVGLEGRHGRAMRVQNSRETISSAPKNVFVKATTAGESNGAQV